jgi:hypothetical protein
MRAELDMSPILREAGESALGDGQEVEHRSRRATGTFLRFGCGRAPPEVWSPSGRQRSNVNVA